MDKSVVRNTSPVQADAEIKPRRIYEADGKDRVLLLLTWVLGFLGVSVMAGRQLPGLGITILTAAWYGVLLWYKEASGLRERVNFLMLGAVLLLALTFSLYSNLWLRSWNLVFLLVLVTVQLFQWSGQGEQPWTSPRMVVERFGLLLKGLFCHLPACWDAAGSYKGDRRWLAAFVGLLLAFPLFTVALLLLTNADPYFAHVVEHLTIVLFLLFGSSFLRLALGLAVVPFLFGLLYALRHPEKREGKAWELPRIDALLPGVVLAVMDFLYVFFIAVQFSVLFGGAGYLEQATGLTYAEYARGGFFQLVFVAILNLSLTLSALQIARLEGKDGRWLRSLSTLLILLSGVILVSAACRMSLYVAVYGLSFKRVLTYWGMGMLGIFFLIALLKTWRKGFCCFKVLFAVSVAGWLVLNFCNVDRLVARYNVSLYQQNSSAMIDLEYLTDSLSYDTLDILEKLPGDTGTETGETLEALLRERRQQARWDAGDWETWSLSAALAAKKK